ncbi:ABC transporter permease [Aquibacillus kalidii]|uniref:ABC transporter permease n=1 Tax=Aquibacillus kalidii TaxID=2762597 RepID=UPI0016486930|nr:ABC transporter permease [Aquibacillus kalidii]
MSINQLILRSLKKNLKNYYLYVFALIFSVALYFAFVTLQFDPSMDEAKGSIKGAAAIKTASVLLIAIVSIFLIYANSIFIKRRSKEIGLFQLIGMTRIRIFRLISMENLIIYFGSLVMGTFIGFSISKLTTMILFKITAVDTVAKLNFSMEAFKQTLLVFSVIYLLIMMMNFLFIKKQSILSLFRVVSKTEGKVKKISILEVLIGVLGIVLIITGYYVSSLLFDGKFTSINKLFIAMVFILASVIIGTYFFYKGSVRFLANLIRKRKGGYLNINDVLSLSSIMFRMKSNALLLTIITTVSALAIGFLALSYIAYYSAEQTAKGISVGDFSLVNSEHAEMFTKKLEQSGIKFELDSTKVLQADVDMENIIGSELKELTATEELMPLAIVSDEEVAGVDVTESETLLTGYNDALRKLMGLKNSGEIIIHGKTEKITQNYIGLNKDTVVSTYFSNGGMPTAIVDKKTFSQLENDLDTKIQKESSSFISINLEKDEDLEEANQIFQAMTTSEEIGYYSYIQLANSQKQIMGLMMFIVGFLGLAFLITSGCILYFKQMGESEEEKPSYTILRKLGFTKKDLVRGIRGKQIFSFGIPLIVGLSHSYFAVQSGWFFFGTELWMPMIIVMLLYTGLYSIFGILSVQYYKKVINSAL